MATLSAEQITYLSEQLDRLLYTAYFDADGYLVSAGMRRVTNNTLGVIVYVNGVINGRWLLDGTDEALKFWRPVTKRRFPSKFIRGMEKVIGKRACASRGYYDTVTHYNYVWSRPQAFLRHLVKHSRSIEVLDYATYKRRLDLIGAEVAA